MTSPSNPHSGLSLLRKALVVLLAATVSLATMRLLVPSDPKAFNWIGPCCTWADYGYFALMDAHRLLPGILIGCLMDSRRHVDDISLGALEAALALAFGKTIVGDPGLPQMTVVLDPQLEAALCGAVGAVLGLGSKHLIRTFARSVKRRATG